MKPEDNLSIDPELEVRVVAWVLGEASPFEAAELTRLVSANPALAIFHRRIQAVHGLLGEAVPPAGQRLRLSPERRSKLRAVIGAPAESKPTERRVLTLPLLHSEKAPRIPLWAYSAAACLLVGMFVVATMPHFGRVRSAGFSLHSLSDAAAQREEAMRKEERTKAPVALAIQLPAEGGPEADLKLKEQESQKMMAEEKLRERNFDALAQTLKRRDSPAQSDVGVGQAAGGSFKLRNGLIVGGGAIAQNGATGSNAARPEPAMTSLNADALKFGIGAPPTTVPVPAAREALSLGYVDEANKSQALSWSRSGRTKLLTTAAAARVGSYGAANPAAAVGSSASTLGVPAIQGGKVASIGSRSQVSYYNRLSKSEPTDFLAFSAPPPSDVNSTTGVEAELSGLSDGPVTMSGPLPVVGKGADAVVKMNPFEVSADVQSGYMATSTLAGTRIKLPLMDSSSALSVVTREFLADTAGAGNRPQPSPEAKAAAGAREFLGTGATEKKDADAPVPHAPARPDPEVRTENETAAQPVSTFSLHVSDVSFRLAQAALARGERPDPASIRPEEFYNAFDYGDPAPAAGEPVACRVEQAQAPFQLQRNLVRIAMRVPAQGREASQPLHLTVLLDTSGSMEREDRAASVRQAFNTLASLLGPTDLVTVIGFARQPRLLADAVKGSELKTVAATLAGTPAEGGTNLEEALKLAAEKARAQFDAKAQNRIVVLSDGAANLGADDPARLSAAVAVLRQEGISFDACGIGVEGLDDSVLESLSRKGDGRYYVINSPEDADASFARKLAGALHPAAQNVKVQVRFNPARVQSYRLIGFEQHRLKAEDFRNDKVTAAELAGDEAAVALYEVQVNPEGEGELGEVYVRFRNAASGAMVERSWTLIHDPRAPAFDRASPSLQLAGAAALLAEKLQAGDAATQVRLSELTPMLNRIRESYAHDPRVRELLTMFEQARRQLGD